MKTFESLKHLIYSHKISVTDVYKGQEVKPPEGYEFTGEFRPPTIEELYLNPFAHFVGGAVGIAQSNFKDPRLILQKIPKKKRWLLEETGEVRTPKKGEYVSMGSFISPPERFPVMCDWDAAIPYKIIKITPLD